MNVPRSRHGLSRSTGVVAALLTTLVLAGGPAFSASADPTPSPTASPSATPTTDPKADPTSDPSSADPSGQPTDSPTTDPTTTATPDPVVKPKALAAPQVVPPATGNNAVITVKVGGDRTGVQSVAPLAGVKLALYANAAATTPVNNTWAQCTSDADGDCSFTVPDTEVNGPNRNAQFYVKQISAPAGWYTNPVLRTGVSDGSGSTSTPYQFQTPAVQSGNTYSSQNQFMVGTGTGVLTASGGIWQQSRVNPVLPDTCGINVSLILDLSGSVSAALPNLKAAANTFTDSLVGTPSRMSLFSFSQDSPATGASQNYPALTSVSTTAGANAFKARYANWNAGGGTNWDRGIESAAAASSDKTDVAVIITDGNPSLYNSPPQGNSNYTRLREVENGIFSANALKARGTRVLAFGVGAGASGAQTALNLRAISGGTAYNGSNGDTADYYQTTDYAAAGAALKKLALGNCTGSVSVTKEIVPSGNTGENITGAVPAGVGWTFNGTTTTAGIGGLPATKTTTADGTGTVNFPLTFPGGVTSANVNLKETQQPNYTLVTQGAKNAVCKDLVTGAAITVTNDNGTPNQPGFTVNAPSTDAVSCTVYNRAPKPPADITVNKRWVINGTSYAEGSQPQGFSAQLSLTGPNGAAASPQGWGVTRTGYSIGDTSTVSETTNLSSDLCRLTTARVTTANGATVNAALPYSASLSQASNTYTVTNTVTCTSLLTLAKVVQGGSAAPTLWNLQAIAPTGALAGPNGATGSPGATNISVTPDVTYQLAESGGDPNYTQVDHRTPAQPNPLSTGSMNCIEVDASGTQIPGYSDGINGGVSVPLGARVKCTATNVTAPLLLIKKVVNTHGGTAVSSDFDLTATPTGNPPAGVDARTVVGSPTGVLTNVRPDQPYDLTETAVPGYTLQSIDCTIGTAAPRAGNSITIPQGFGGSCTYTNVDQPAKLTLEKVVNGAAAGSGKVPADWTLTATPDGITGQGPVSGNGDPTSPGGVSQVSVFSGSYDLSESGPAGFDPGSWICEGGVVTGSTVAVPTGGNVVCRITNTARAPKLTLVKDVINDDGGTAVATDWDLAASGPTPINGPSGDPAVSSAPVKVGTYTLSEDGGPPGYTPTDWTCTGATVTGGNKITLAEGDDATCTITNDDQAASLTLVKTVDHGDTGATDRPTAWTLTAAGPTPGVTGAVGDPAVTDSPVSAGDYTLSESGGPSGYTPSSWSCTGATVSGDTVTVPLGADVTCTINNTAEQPHLTLVKTVDNGETGATRVPTDWTLTADGPTAGVTGAVGDDSVTNAPVKVGDYALSESGPDGYTPSPWSCTGATVSRDTVTVPLGADVTCSINNTAQVPHLTLVKEVVNDNGGTALPTAWALAADGPTTDITGATGSDAVTNVPVKVGSYDLSESGGPSGYDASAWTCTGGAKLTGATVTVAPGQDVTCTITNDDEAGAWTFSKASDPPSGSTVQPGDTITYTLTARKLSGVDPTDVVVEDDLSKVLDNATLVAGSIVASSGTATESGNKLSWTIPTLSATETLTYQVKVNADAYGVTLTNHVTSPTGEPCVPEGEQALSKAQRAARAATDCTTTTHKTPKWSLTKTSDPKSGSTVAPGSTIAYTLTVTNGADATLSGAVVTDNLADVLDHGSLVAVPAGATLSGTTLTWHVPTLTTKGAKATLTYRVKLDSDAYGVTVTNHATPSKGGGCTVCTTTHHTPPKSVPPPPHHPTIPSLPLPGTGGPAGWLLYGGLVLLFTGGLAMAVSRRSRRA